MKFSKFANYLQTLEGTSARLSITATLAELFRELEIDETAEACYLLQGQLLPPYASVEFQIAVKTVQKAAARLADGGGKEGADSDLFGETTAINPHAEQKILKAYHELGDLGLVVEQELAHHEPTHALSIREVYAALFDLAKDNGAQSQQRKLDALVALFQKLDATSAKFVTRVILGRLRLGFSDMTMIDALSWAMTSDKTERTLLEDAYQKKADIGKLATFYLQQKDATKRQHALQKYQVEVGVPVLPALCQRLNSAAEMIEKMHSVIAEPKYDGLRVQIHINKPHVKTFTRNLEETTPMFPELQHALVHVHADSCILDAEAVGYDTASGGLLPFQQTMQRKRKHDVAAKSQEVPVRFFVFDVLALNGEDLLQTPLQERKKKLHALFKDNAILVHAPELRTSDSVALHKYHEEQLAEGLEGVVVKQLDSVYQSGRKGWSWVKMKEAEGTSGKLADTLDVIVMGYYLGRGKRTGFGIGAVLVGVWDAKREKVATVAKIGTGLTDETLRTIKQKCDELATKTKPAHYDVQTALIPNVWCLPGLVIEVAADEVTVSPIHTAEMALRFPRLVQFRNDKQWQDATTLTELKQLAKS